MQLYIYDKTTLQIAGRPYVKDYKAFELNPSKFYPSFNPEIHIAKTVEIQNPKLENDDIIEKTRVDLVKEGAQSLYDGEVLVDNEIMYTPAPEGLLKAQWTGTEWIEAATTADYESEIERLIDDYIDLDKKKTERASYGFNTKEIESKIAENFLKRMEFLAKLKSL
jgi:hypothetical protein